MKVLASKTDPPLGAILTCTLGKIQIEWGAETKLSLSDTVTLTTSSCISRHIARVQPGLDVYPEHILLRTEVDHWLTVASALMASNDEFATAIAQLAKVLAPSTYLVGKALSVADIEVFAALHRSAEWQALIGQKKANGHLVRWYLMVKEKFATVLSTLPADVSIRLSMAATPTPVESTSTSTKVEDRGKFVDLPGAKMGEVVVRFPPEASGYLHIGHAKAALLNQYYQLAFKGKLIMRFDDTNPAKEKADFEKVILEDLQLLQIKPDVFTYTSDHFDRILGLCEKMVRQGDAYCDDTEAETMKREREERKESCSRSNTMEENLHLWEEMKQGTNVGQKCCVRAKIDMASDNGCMRDPTIYRCKDEPHVRTGYKYKVYPTYDFACPIVDSVEGVTHALRTTEYLDRDEQYAWFIQKLGLRKPHIYSYSRLCMTNTVLSKRKLTWFVLEGLVDGWDDPRFPTVRGILRHGLTVDGLKEFIVAQGSSRSVVNMEWDKIWAFNKKVIDRTAPRFTALEGQLVPVIVKGALAEKTQAPRHPKDASLGTKDVWRAPTVLLEAADAAELKEGENTTFINWGNLLIKKIHRGPDNAVQSVEAEPNLANVDYKKTLKVTWMADIDTSPKTPLLCVYFDHLISKAVLAKDEDFKAYVGHPTRAEVVMVGDSDMRQLRVGDIVQLQRKGFFRVDREYRAASLSSCVEAPVILFHIPDGHTKAMPSGSAFNRVTLETGKLQVDGGELSTGAVSITNVNSTTSGSIVSCHDLDQQIRSQGDKIRDMKNAKTDKNAVMAEVETLKKLKADFKVVVGVEWKPELNASTLSGGKDAAVSALQVVSESTGAVSITNVNSTTSGSIVSCHDLDQQIRSQGDKIRDMKNAKTDKNAVMAEVETLKKLKADFKLVVGVEWKPELNASTLSGGKGAAVSALQVVSEAAEAINPKILNIQPQKSITLVPVTCTTNDNKTIELLNNIKEQGDKVRALKEATADKTKLTEAVNALLAFKKEFKEVSGVEWKPNMDFSQFLKANASDATQVSGNALVLDFHERIKQQGEKVRTLKTGKAAKDAVTAEVNLLLALKKEFKEASSVEWRPDLDISQFTAKTGNSVVPAISTVIHTVDNPKVKAKNMDGKSKASPVVKPKEAPTAEVAGSGLKKQTRLGLEARKEDNLADWYSQVITKAEMIEYYNVSGCYILRPWSYAIWDFIKDFIDKQIKVMGVENTYFPMFVAKEALEKEQTHLADFSPEVAWVTRSGSTDMAEPIALRPTSETVMYPSFAKWVQSHRDLPLRLNQWCNVVRWEFKQPTPFLRTREFLWQEGHTAFATREEAVTEVHEILALYARVYEELLAIPVVRGRKTEKEKFAGADFTTTVEAYVSANGRAIQGATSHHLGQNFSRMFEIQFEDPDSKTEPKEKIFVHQNSWGLTTRTIGVMVMVHGDNKGLVLPPRVAGVQLMIIPVGITGKSTDAERKALTEACETLRMDLVADGVRARCDLRDNVTAGWKFNHWELKGVPIRVELGPREVNTGQVVAVRRDTGEKISLARATMVQDFINLLTTIHDDLLAKATTEMRNHTVTVTTWSDFSGKLEERNILLAPFCGRIECEENIKKDSARDEGLEVGAPSMGAKALCIPFKQPAKVTGIKCIHPACGQMAKFYTLFGRSY